MSRVWRSVFGGEVVLGEEQFVSKMEWSILGIGFVDKVDESLGFVEDVVPSFRQAVLVAMSDFSVSQNHLFHRRKEKFSTLLLLSIHRIRLTELTDASSITEVRREE